MVLESVLGSLLSIGGVVSLVVNVIITAIAIMIVGKLIGGEASPKGSIIMAFVAYLVVPLAISYLLAFVPLLATVGIIIPLIVWVLLGEALLKADRKNKAIIAIVAFVVNLLLLGIVTSAILSIVPF